MEKLEEKLNISFGMKQVVLWILLFAGLFIASFVALGQSVSIGMVAQNVAVFIAPAAIFAYLVYKAPWRFLRLDKAPALKDILLVVAVMIVSLPAMNYLVDLNSQMHLPDWMSGVEEWMRESEDAAQELTSSLINTTSLAEMLWLVLIVGVLTGIGEEMFFRGAMLGTFLLSTCSSSALSRDCCWACGLATWWCGHDRCGCPSSRMRSTTVWWWWLLTLPTPMLSMLTASTR